MKFHIVFDCDGTLLDTSHYRYSLFPGIKELLADLAQDSILYVWTARDRASLIRILEEHGVYSYFDSFCTLEDAHPKPHISGLIELVGMHPKDSICVIGDTSNDILGARNFGVKSIAAGWNKELNGPYLREIGADFIVMDPIECSRIIRLNLKGDTHV